MTRIGPRDVDTGIVAVVGSNALIGIYIIIILSNTKHIFFVTELAITGVSVAAEVISSVTATCVTPKGIEAVLDTQTSSCDTFINI